MGYNPEKICKSRYRKARIVKLAAELVQEIDDEGKGKDAPMRATYDRTLPGYYYYFTSSPSRWLEERLFNAIDSLNDQPEMLKYPAKSFKELMIMRKNWLHRLEQSIG